MNDHLMNHQVGQDFVVNLDSTGVRDLETGSDYIPPGRYEGYVEELDFVAKSDSTGHSTAMVVKVLSPDKYKGLKIKNFGAAPFGAKAETGIQQLVKLDKSICSFADQPAPVGGFQRGRADLVNKPFGFTVEDDNYKGKVVSRVAWFITKADYVANPGPTDKNHPGTPPDLGMMPASAPPAPTASVVGGTAPAAVIGGVPAPTTVAPAAAIPGAVPAAMPMAAAPSPVAPAPMAMAAAPPAATAPAATTAPPANAVSVLSGVTPGGNAQS